MFCSDESTDPRVRNRPRNIHTLRRMTDHGATIDEQRAKAEALAIKAANGDKRALDDLLVLIERDVFQRCLRILPNRLDAEEATQDAMLTVARRISGFEGQSKFSTWLYRVSSNASIDTYRKLKRRSEDHNEMPEITDLNRTSVIAGTRIDLLDALEQVDARFAEPVVLRDVQGLDYGDIAELLNVPVGTVKSRIHEGRKTLQWLLDRD